MGKAAWPQGGRSQACMWGQVAGQTGLQAIPVWETEGDKSQLLHTPVSLPPRPSMEGH